jgi:hypothetical protein
VAQHANAVLYISPGSEARPERQHPRNGVVKACPGVRSNGRHRDWNAPNMGPGAKKSEGARAQKVAAKLLHPSISALTR